MAGQGWCRQQHMMVCALAASLVVILCAYTSDAATPEQWRSRIIYQVVTDRFAPTVPQGHPTSLKHWLKLGNIRCNLSNQFCGGTFKGLQQQLQYIKDLGADAIWMSPPYKNAEGGYHGYWPVHLEDVDPHFGTQQDLIDLTAAAHNMSMLMMLDVVANHMGPVADITTVFPFNKSQHYHSCSSSDAQPASFADLAATAGCDQWCSIPTANYPGMPAYDPKTVEHCKLANLHDLDQSNPEVRDYYLKWPTRFTKKFGFDGMRIDAAPYVSKTFWQAFSNTSDMMTIGEAWDQPLGLWNHNPAEQKALGLNPYMSSPEFVSQFVPRSNALDSMLNYPMYGPLRLAFQKQEDMRGILHMRNRVLRLFPQPYLLGSFIDSHDGPRMFHFQKDEVLRRNALAYVLLGEGIPIIYYGSEQGLEGPGRRDFEARELMWPSGFRRSHNLYQWIAKLAAYRKRNKLYNYRQLDIFATENCYAFEIGTTLVVLSNVGSEGNTECSFMLPKDGPLPTPVGPNKDAYLANAFDLKAPLVRVRPNNAVTVSISRGEPLVLKIVGAKTTTPHVPSLA